jgi:predicted nucleotidyltransferase
MLSNLITSKTRLKILGLFLINPGKEYYLRDIARRLKENINSVRRELKNLEDAGIVKSRREATLKYYAVNKENPIYDELKSIYLKTEGIGDELRKELAKTGKIETAYIYGSYAKGTEKPASDIDLMIIGEVDQGRLAAVVGALESRIGREINYSVFTSKEYKLKEKKNDPYITDVSRGKKIKLI